MKALIVHDDSHVLEVLTQIFFQEKKKIKKEKLFYEAKNMILFDVIIPKAIYPDEINDIRTIKVKSPMLFMACEKQN